MKRVLALVFLGLAINTAAISAAQAHDRGWYGAREADDGGGWVVGAVVLGGILAAMTAPQPPVYVQPAPVIAPQPPVYVQPAPVIAAPPPVYVYPAQPSYYIYPSAPVYVQPAYPVRYRYGRRDRDDD